MSQSFLQSQQDKEEADGPPAITVHPQMAKSFKRRASKACSFCQWRKIRCNVEDHHPCNNCVLEKIECSITKTRKSKKSKHHHDLSEPRPLPEQDLIAIVQPEKTIAPNFQQTNLTVDAQAEHPSVDHPLATPSDHASLPAHEPNKIVEAPSLSLTPSLSSIHSPQGLSNGIQKSQTAQVVLPDFLEPIPSHLPPEDVEYLHKKGCFEIPAPKFRDAILRCYAEFVHPYTPLLDLARFLHDITTSEHRANRVSLLLFQAVMFAGCAHVDIKPLRMLGFLTRKAARRALYFKTKALYDMEYERNRLCVIRVLALMSYWYETPDDQKNACHWLQIALSLSRRAGLDKNPAHMNMDETERRMRRRIWWSCVNRDPLCALGLKAPLCCSLEDHDVPDLVVEDYDLGDVPQDGFNKVGVEWPPGKRRLLCMASVAQTQLHRHLRSILAKQYILGNQRGNGGNPDEEASRMVLIPMTTDSSRSNLTSLGEELRSWRTSLPSELQTTAVGSEISDSGFEAFVVFRTVLHMLYHTCLITLYRPWVQAQGGQFSRYESLDEERFQHEIQTTVRESAHSITDLAVELHQLDLVRHLPQTGLSSLIAAVVSHISDVMSSADHIRTAGLRGFEQCSQMLNELRENYYAADFSYGFAKLLAQAKRLSQKPKTADAGLTFIGEMYDEGISARSGLLSTADESAAGDPRPPLGRVVGRPLPQALFPEGVDLSTNWGAAQENSPAWDPAVAFDTTAGTHDAMMSHELGDDWDYYRNFRDETARLLGEYWDGYQGSLQHPLPGIEYPSH